jgi:hypothetical protein
MRQPATKGLTPSPPLLVLALIGGWTVQSDNINLAGALVTVTVDGVT